MNASELIKRVTVRIDIEEKSRSGSGVFYNYPENPDYILVFTAKHVIDGENFDDPAHVEQVVCQYKLYKDDRFHSFKILKIIRNLDNDADQCILLLASNVVGEILKHIPSYNISNLPIYKEELQFRGYPAIFSEERIDVAEAQLFNSKLNELDRNYFKVEMRQDLFDSEFEEAKKRFSGISGAGLFLVNDYTNTIHLTGLVRGFINKKGSFNIIKFSYLLQINDLLKEEGLNEVKIYPGIYTKDISYNEDLKYHIGRLVYRAIFDKVKGETEIDEQTLLQVFKRFQKVSLLGVGGLGKSLELKHIHQELKSQGYLPTPVINLQNIEEKPLAEILNEELPCWETIPENKFIILLDGLDETSNFDNIVRRLERFVEIHKDSKIIISCRQNFYLSDSTLKNFTSYILKELSKEDALNYLNHKLVGIGGLDEQMLSDALERLGCLVNPFYLVNFTKLIKLGSVSTTASQLQILEELVSVSSEKNLEHYDSEIRRRLISAKDKTEKELIRLAVLITVLGNRTLTDIEYFSFTIDSNLRDNLSLVKFWIASGSGNKFEHKNFSDYLVSKAADSLSYPEFIKLPIIIDGYILPNFLNPLVQWLSLSRAPKTAEFFSTNLIKNLEVFLGMDLNNVRDDDKQNIFKSIIEKFENRGLYLGYERETDLGKLASNEGVVKPLVNFLLNKIEKHASGDLMLKNSIGVLENIRIPEEQKSKVSEVLVATILANASNHYLVHDALYSLSRLKLNTKKNLDLLIINFATTKSQYVKSGLYYAIYLSESINEYVDFLLNEVNLFIINTLKSYTEETLNPHEVDLIDVKMNLRRALNSVNSLEGLKKILTFFGSLRPSYLSEFEIIEGDSYVSKDTINEKLLLHKNDFELFQIVLNLYLELSRYGENGAGILAQFIKEVGKAIEVIGHIIPTDWSDYTKAQQIKPLLTESEIGSIIEFYQHGAINEDFIKSLFSDYKYSLPLELKEILYIKVYDINKDFIKPYRTEEEAVIFNSTLLSRKLDFIFNLAAIQEQLKLVFEGVGKDQITLVEFDDFLKDRYKDDNIEHQVIYEVFEEVSRKAVPYNRKDPILKEDVFSHILNPKFYDYQIDFLYQGVNYNYTFQANSEIIEKVTDWVNLKLQENHDLYTIEYIRHLYGFLWYFHQRFSISLHSEKLLDFLHFDLNQYNFKQPESIHNLPFDIFEPSSSRKHDEFLDLLKEEVEETEIQKQVLKNIEQGLPSLDSASRHLTYCNYFALTESINFLKSVVLNQYSGLNFHSDEHNLREDAIDILSNLNLKALEECLPELPPDDYVIIKIEKSLLKRNSPAIYEHLKEKMLLSEGEQKITIAKKLFIYEDVNALEVYTASVEANNFYEEHYSDNDFTNGKFISELKTPEAVPFLFRMLRTSFHPDFKPSQNTNSLQGVVNAGLNNISKQSQVFELIISGYKDLFRDFPLLKYLQSTIENFEEQKVIAEFNALTFDEAKTLVESISF